MYINIYICDVYTINNNNSINHRIRNKFNVCQGGGIKEVVSMVASGMEHRWKRQKKYKRKTNNKRRKEGKRSRKKLCA